MAGLTPKSVHVSAPLTNLAIKYKNLALVGERVFPVIPVRKESDKYYVFGKEELILENALRAAGAEAREIDWDVTSATYTAEAYALRHLVPDRIVANADVAIRPKMSTTNKLTKKLQIAAERRVQALAQDTANATSSAVPSPKWNGTSPTIEKDVDTAKDTVRKAAGVEPTSILIPYSTAQAVKRDATVRNLIRYTITGQGGWELLRNGDLPPVLWNLEVIVAGSIYNSAREGATEVLADIWTDTVTVFYKEPSPSLDALSFGYIFRVGNFLVKTYRIEVREGEMIEVQHIQDEKVVASAAAYMLTDVLS